MSPRRASVELLPDDVKAWIDKALVGSGFSGYEALAAALEEKGFAISKSALHRYGSKFEESLASIKIATEQAKAIIEACPDDAGAMNEALMRMTQEQTLRILTELQNDTPNLVKIGHMVADMTRASVNQKKWAEQVRARTQIAAAEVTQKARKGGLSEEAIKQIEEEILGIAR